ncbi:hypothetical protein [Niveibacterium sp.]|uniref:hypothetical protein n=1 Tax=Niveibacterium sp. TaxID=2017444 RepID=UPI0035AEF24E
MAYETFVAFKSDFLAAHKSTYQFDAKADFAQAAAAFRYYLHGLEQGARSGLNIGLIEHLQELLAKNKSVFDGGGIFVDTSNQDRWRLFYNDAFILGGIHSHGPFTLVHTDRLEHGWVAAGKDQRMGFAGAKQLDFHTGDTPYLRVTQREVLALNIFGYAGSPGEDGSMAFKCTNPQLADSATFVRYKNEVGDLEGALAA